jgi:CRISPR/Cas system-associated endonuclease Cas1
LEAGVDIVYLNSFGTPVGRILSSSPKGMAKLRKAPVRLPARPKTLELSRTLQERIVQPPKFALVGQLND